MGDSVRKMFTDRINAQKERSNKNNIKKKKAAKAQIVPDIFPFLNSSPFPLHLQPSAQTEEKKVIQMIS